MLEEVITIAKTSIKLAVLALNFLVLSSCVADKTPGTKASCPAGFAFDEVSRSCTAAGSAPIGTLSQVNVVENSGNNLIELSYNDGNNDEASRCRVLSDNPSEIEVASPRQYQLAQESIDLLAVVTSAYNIITPVATTQYNVAVNSVATLRGTSSLAVSLSARDNFLQATRFIAEAAIANGGGVAVTTGFALRDLADDYESYFAFLSDRCHCTSGRCETVVVPKYNVTGNSSFRYSVSDPTLGAGPTRSVNVSINPETKYPIPRHADVTVLESDTSTPVTRNFLAPEALPFSFLSYSIVSPTQNGSIVNCFISGQPATCQYEAADADMSDTFESANVQRATFPEEGEFASQTFQDLVFDSSFKGDAGNNTRVRLSEYKGLGHPQELSVRVMSDSQGPIVDVVVLSSVTTEQDVQAAINASSEARDFVEVSGATTSTITATELTLSGGVDAQDGFNYRVCDGMVCSRYDGRVTIHIQEVNDAPMIDIADSLDSLVPPILEDTPFIIELAYTDVDSDLMANACLANSNDLTVVTACDCDVMTGICTVELQSTPDFYGNTIINAQVTNDGLSSLTGEIPITLDPVNDYPRLRELSGMMDEHLFTDMTPYSILENDGVNIGSDEQLTSIPLLIDRGDILTAELENDQEFTFEIEITYMDPPTYSPQDVIPMTSEFVEVFYNCDPDSDPSCESIVDPNTDDATTPVSVTLPAASLGNLRFRLTADAFKSTTPTGIDNLRVIVRTKDDGGTDDGGVDLMEHEFELEVVNVDFPPTIESIANVEMNEGGYVYSHPFIVTEGGLSVEPDQDMEIEFSSDNEDLLPPENISVHYDENGNGLPEVSEEKNDPGAILDYELEDPTATPKGRAGDFPVILRLRPVGLKVGVSNITVTVSDGTNQADMTFALIVHPISANHGGWSELRAVSNKTYDKGQLDPERICKPNSDKCDGGGDCTGTMAPNSNISADEENVVFYDSANDRCYYSTASGMSNWKELNTFCDITSKADNENCVGENCMGAGAPAITPTDLNQFFFDYTNNACYRSIGTEDASDWESYFPSRIKIAWNDFEMSGSGADSDASIAGWNVYRRGFSEAFDFSSPLNDSPLSPTTREFYDDTANEKTLYYYVVRPLDSKRMIPTATNDIFSEVRILTPPRNMALVHRWMANNEVCQMMGKSLSALEIDPEDNFSCEYQGPGKSTNDRYDIGRDLFVDRVEAGCPFTRSSQAVSVCQSSNGCIGLGEPTFPNDGATNDDELIYYDRSSGTCYKADGASGWDPIEDLAGDFGNVGFEKLLEGSQRSLLPPIVNLRQETAAAFCQERAEITGITGIDSGATLASTLPSRKEQIAYSAAPLDISDSAFGDIERGLSLNSSSKCNSSSANGIESGYNNSEIPSTSFHYSLPGTSNSGIRSMTTGSVPVGQSMSTEACESRYGLQDVYGNVAEWVTDRLTCDPSDQTCAGVVFGDANDELIVEDVTDNFKLESDGVYVDGGGAEKPYGLDGILGPCRDIDSDGTCDATLSEWVIGDVNFNSSYFFFPVGLPLTSTYVSTAPSNALSVSALQVGPTSGITRNQLKEDKYIFNTAALEQVSGTNMGAMATGGGYKDGSGAGRYTLELLPDQDVTAVAASGGEIDADSGTTTLSFTAKEAGSAGNQISVTLNDTGAAPPEVSVSGSFITVNIDAGVSTADDIRLAIEADTQADLLVAVTITGSATDVFSAALGPFLTGGLDEVSAVRNDVGFRCMVPIEEGFYEADEEHTYPY